MKPAASRWSSWAALVGAAVLVLLAGIAGGSRDGIPGGGDFQAYASGARTCRHLFIQGTTSLTPIIGYRISYADVQPRYRAAERAGCRAVLAASR